jgi:hypothetical protein
MLMDHNEKSDHDQELYANINGEKVKIDIPEEGALGILAYGAVGLKAWRKVKLEAQKKRNIQNDSQPSDINE